MEARAQQGALGWDAAVVGVMSGTSTYMRELALPFLEDVTQQLEATHGVPNVSAAVIERRFPSLPGFPSKPRPQNALGLDDLLVGLGIYVTAPLANAIIEKIGSDIYGVVKPALARMWARLRRQQPTPRRPRVTFDHWFDGSKVLVRVAFLPDPSGSQPDLDLIPIALRQAMVWLQANPVTHRVLAYEIRDGRLAREPILSEPV